MGATPCHLPVIESCDGCGACCLVVTSPPFRRTLDGGGEEAWVRLRWEHPALVAELEEAQVTRKAAGEPSYGTPCLWFDPASGRCRNYELRPRACRDFAVGSQDCHDARRRAGVSPR
jgi:Fe-S-cluster containining protein